MPIRINLLAEQLAAEEARRKDPVKRAIWAASILTALALLWSIMLIFKVSGARSEVATLQANLTRLEDEAREIKDHKRLADEAYGRVQALERYASNRFLWGNVLNDLQHAVKKVEGIKLDELMGEQRYTTNGEIKTKVSFKLPYSEPPAAWKFWSSAPAAPNYPLLITNEFRSLTNKAPYVTNRVALSMKLINMVTNTPPDSITANVEIITPITATEETVIIVRARDYAKEVRRIDAFSKALNEGAYLKERLSKGPGGGIFLREIGKPKEEGIVGGGEMYTPFTLELQFNPRVFTSEAQ